LVVEKMGRSESRDSRNRDKSRDKSRGKYNKFANVECHYCHQKGHIQRFCRQLKREKQKEKGKEKKSDDDSDDNRVTALKENFLTIFYGDVVNFVSHETSWVIDSGASVHATSRRDFFTSYRSGDFGSVKMGNNGLAQAVGIGDVCLETRNGTRLVLNNVKHIPDIRLNLISTGNGQ